MDNAVNKAYQFFKQYPGHLKTATDEIAERLNISYDDVSRGRSIYKDDHSQSNSKNKLEDRIEDKPDSIKNLYKEFLEKHEIDKQDVVQVYFKEKPSGTYFTVQTRHGIAEDFDPAEVFRQEIAEYTPPEYSISRLSFLTEENCGIFNIFDAHLDKISSIDDTDEESTIEGNIKLFEDSFDKLLEFMVMNEVEHILFPFGNDFYHTNDHRLTTKRGTSMADGVHITDMEAFKLGVRLIRRCIDKARHIAPVTLIPVEGNHDSSRVKYLQECLIIAYENQSDVEVIDNYRSRKYQRYGQWLFGFTHGDDNLKVADFGSLMSTDKDSRKHWSEIDKGVFFVGHLHNEKRYRTMENKDFRGCKVQFLRAISSTDTWHWKHGYTAIPKTAYGFVYSKDGKQDLECKINL
jgi:hypothetical protein